MTDLIEFSEYIGMKYEIIDVGLEYFSSIINNSYKNWKVNRLEYILNLKTSRSLIMLLYLIFLKKSNTFKT